ncbi:MAG TPA: nitroreductase [Spirochaetaceae bacterium]|nr:nitroreductase [Spirochaetaceae bacterium]
MDISLETLHARSSVRNYLPQALGQDTLDALSALIQGLEPCPFGTSPRFALSGKEIEADKTRGAIGTYGVIKGAPAYIVGCTRPEPWAFVDYGYAMEGLILGATALGLGTCWLGGIFNRGAAGRSLGLREGEVVPAISPVGIPSGRGSLADRIIRGSAGSDRRKPWSELFFADGWATPLSEEGAGPYAPVLTALRAGPSASNKQPWRVVLTRTEGGTALHLYLKEDLAYTKAIPGVLLQDLDAGIAMRHVSVACAELRLPGSWKRLTVDPAPGPAPLRYIASWLP